MGSVGSDYYYCGFAYMSGNIQWQSGNQSYNWNNGMVVLDRSGNRNNGALYVCECCFHTHTHTFEAVCADYLNRNNLDFMHTRDIDRLHDGLFPCQPFIPYSFADTGNDISDSDYRIMCADNNVYAAILPHFNRQ